MSSTTSDFKICPTVRGKHCLKHLETSQHHQRFLTLYRKKKHSKLLYFVLFLETLSQLSSAGLQAAERRLFHTVSNSERKATFLRSNFLSRLSPKQCPQKMYML